jgi:hypothetical protein
LDTAHLELQRRISSIALPGGRGIAYVDDCFDHRDAKVVISLLKRALPRLMEQNAPSEVVALVPGQPTYDRFVRFSISTEDGKNVEIHACESESARYSLPAGLRPVSFEQIIRMQASGMERRVRCSDLIASGKNFRVAIVVESHPESFELVGTAPTGGLKSRTVERIRQVLLTRDGTFQLSL